MPFESYPTPTNQWPSPNQRAPSMWKAQRHPIAIGRKLLDMTQFVMRKRQPVPQIGWSSGTRANATMSPLRIGLSSLTHLEREQSLLLEREAILFVASMRRQCWAHLLRCWPGRNVSPDELPAVGNQLPSVGGSGSTRRIQRADG